MLWKMLLSLFLTSGNHVAQKTAPETPCFPATQHHEDLLGFTSDELLILDHIDKQLHRHINWKIKRLIGMAYAKGMNYQTLNRGFIFLHGQSFRSYRRLIRLQAAKLLISKDRMAVEKVVKKVGYTNIAILERDFYKYTQISLSDFQSTYAA
jgi:AraC-like DNA-binding protein